jgi:hypothetical protein
MLRIRSDLYLFVALALVGVVLTAALLFLPDHREVDARDMPAPASVPVAPK